MPDTQQKTDIIPAQRRNLILELIRQRGVASVNELSDTIGVSPPTIRRDLDWLAKTGAVQRSHGGATLTSSQGTTFEPESYVSSRIARKQKKAIACVAINRLRDNHSVIFDSSSTVLELAYQVVKKGVKLTAVTNDLRIGELLGGSPSIHLLVSGGALRPGSYTLVGEPGMRFLQRLHADVAVMGIHAINGSACCDTSLEVAYAKRYMVAAAKQVIVLADATKFGQVAFYDAFEIDARFEIITDRSLDPATHGLLEKLGAVITIAGRDCN
jgi:DeoR family transcriptional regulator of aga operon